MKTFFGTIVVLCAVLVLFPSYAQEKEAEPSQQVPVTSELNQMMAQRAKLMIEAHKLESEINKAVNNRAVTSPEIEKLRKKIEDLRTEILKTFAQIREEIEKLPETIEKRKQIAEKNRQVEALNKKIDGPHEKQQ